MRSGYLMNDPQSGARIAGKQTNNDMVMLLLVVAT